MKCVIIDDEPKAIEILERYVKKTAGLEMLATFDRPLEALSFLKNNRPDCVFLDINMPHLNGLQLSRLLGNVPVIFTTAYPQFALDSYEVSAIDYLLKPIALPRFLKAVAKLRSVIKANDLIIHATEDSDRVILVKSGTKTYRVQIDKIDYLETLGNYIIFHTEGINIRSRLTVNGLSEILPIDKFVRLHKSFIVAKNQIFAIESHQVTTKSGAVLPIGAAYRNNLKGIFLPGSPNSLADEH
jgi:two-component system LytT family response regulator